MLCSRPRNEDFGRSAMAVVIAKEEWQLSPLIYVFLFACCFSSVFLLPYFLRGGGAVRSTTTASSLFDVGPTLPFLRFQRSFLLLYSLASLMEGLESVYGDFEFAYHGMSREQMVLVISASVVVSLLVGSFAGVLSDIIGPRNICILFCFLHLLVGILKSITRQPSMLLSTIFIGLGSTIFSFCFETWMVAEHEKQGHRIDLLSETFWLMTLFESSSYLGSQGIANLLIKDLQKGFLSPSAPAALLAIISILYIRKEWNSNHQISTFGSYQKSFTGHILSEKSIWILGWAQGSVHFSISVFWILWAPIIVADGREVQLSRLYPCFLGSRMLGSTVYPWFSTGASPLHNEDHHHLTAAFVVAGSVLLVVAYDYQDTGVLVVLFCIFNACIGLISPSLARLRTMYVPNELRGGMISASLAPANAAFLFVLIFGGYYRCLSSSLIMAFAAVGLYGAAGCIHVLRWWRRNPRQNWHEL